MTHSRDKLVSSFQSVKARNNVSNATTNNPYYVDFSSVKRDKEGLKKVVKSVFDKSDLRNDRDRAEEMYIYNINGNMFEDYRDNHT